MSGKNIWLVLVAVLAGIGIFYLVTGPAQTPVVEAPLAPATGPRAVPPAPAASTALSASEKEAQEAIDAVAADAAKDIERLKQEQEREMMMEKPPAPEMEKRN